MSEVGAVAGTKVYIAPANTDIPPASPDVWVEIKDISNIGDIGTTFAKIARESVGDGYTRQIKGTESATAFPLVCNRDDDDPGQVALRAAAGDRNSFFPFKVLENDGSSATFLGRVYGKTNNYGGVNDLKKFSTEIEIEPDSIEFDDGE